MCNTFLFIWCGTNEYRVSFCKHAWVISVSILIPISPPQGHLSFFNTGLFVCWEKKTHCHVLPLLSPGLISQATEYWLTGWRIAWRAPRPLLLPCNTISFVKTILLAHKLSFCQTWLPHKERGAQYPPIKHNAVLAYVLRVSLIQRADCSSRKLGPHAISAVLEQS